jgi:hypothetical protein
MRRGRGDSGAPKGPVSGACAGNAPKFLIKPVINVKLLLLVRFLLFLHYSYTF